MQKETTRPIEISEISANISGIIDSGEFLQALHQEEYKPVVLQIIFHSGEENIAFQDKIYNELIPYLESAGQYQEVSCVNPIKEKAVILQSQLAQDNEEIGYLYLRLASSALYKETNDGLAA